MTVRRGNILDVTHGVILQQVNAQGVMASGVAKAIRQRYPVVWDDYRLVVGTYPVDDEKSSEVMGKAIWSQVADSEDGPLHIVSIVGQRFYRGFGQPEMDRYTSYDALDIALTTIGDAIRHAAPDATVHYPLIGSDRGGGHWPIVRSILEHRLAGIKHQLWLLPDALEPV